MIALVFSVLISLCLFYLGWCLWTIVIYHWLFSPIQQLPGPVLQRFFSTNLQFVMEPEMSPHYHDKWESVYGKTFCIHGFGKAIILPELDPRILTLDPKAMTHVLNEPITYPKPWQSRRLISELIGNGLFSAEGASHRRQRKVLNPAFSNHNLQSFGPLFTSQVFKLRDAWKALLGKEREVSIDVAHWFSRATFDVIGIAGFDYHFNALEAESNPVYLAYREMFQVGVDDGFTARSILEVYLPILKKIWPDKRTNTIRRSHDIIYGVGRQLLERRKKELEEDRRTSLHTKDLLGLMIFSNLSPDITEDQRISDQDMLDEINSFFFAGSDSTSLALSWTLYLLATTPEAQTRLRKEVLSLDADASFKAIDALTFLDKCCREELRLIPPVHSSLRVADRDDILPLSTSIQLRNGEVVDQVHVPKGTCIHIPIEGFNLLSSVWGPDAHRFNPDRWDNLPSAVKDQPGLYSNLMTFSGGPRGCIGMRFSIMEMKIFLFQLVRSFEFVAKEKVVKRNVVLTRPFVLGKRRSQLPIIIRMVDSRDEGTTL
ncbi:cytochrome-450 hydroxylase [Dacryopinax primogenitus]|uniref:Cytochrome-450 hydroxylase n=1 Tax=Dacryopinax primogenitus (strain DJM 731) TaxID=1858805 RepID=M5G4R8_DACPD|nr:cytochrome-450 hydroxylase [Dacryopinax primogenitus]EJU00857.1 cytochrome-450 hydroxylase [Dacryopinax primogenitus]